MIKTGNLAMRSLNEQEDEQQRPAERALEYSIASDRMLVTRAQSGEPQAFDQLMRKYHDRVMKVTLRYTRNQADAEDAAQNTFMRAYRGLKYFRGDAAFYSWLHRIAINSAATILGSRRRDESLFRPDASAPAELKETSESFKELDTPEELALTEEILEEVLSSIRYLCEDQRTAIVLHELEGRSYAEVATAMSCPIGTVRSRVYRAREVVDNRLRVIYEEGLGRVKRAAPSGSLAACSVACGKWGFVGEPRTDRMAGCRLTVAADTD
jgi:RNA polymerase sigma-70 factor (ECF subfamily)